MTSPRIYLTCCLLEVAFYIMALVLFTSALITLYKLWIRNRNSTSDNGDGGLSVDAIHVAILGTMGSLLFIFATIHVGAVIARTYNGFVFHDKGPFDYFGLLKNPETSAAEVGQFGAIFFSDAYSSFRLYLICLERPGLVYKTGVVLTFILTCCSFAFGTKFIVTSQTLPPTSSQYGHTLKIWTITFLSISLAITTISAVFTLLRLRNESFQQRRAMIKSRSESQDIKRLLHLWIQSAATYAIVNLIYLVLFAIKRSEQSIFSTLISPIASITFNHIIVRGDRAIERRGEEKERGMDGERSFDSSRDNGKREKEEGMN